MGIVVRVCSCICEQELVEIQNWNIYFSINIMPPNSWKWARLYFPNIHSNVLNIDIPQFHLVICDYIQRTFVEHNLMGVFDFKTTCGVDLNCHTCSCGKWRNLGIACSHAIAASHYSNIIELKHMV
uniref:SWIM-type domain-containing protein n=1 Tax=Lactuca sativa TaxID=4236 RepID=A0A9R1V4Q3_LACSA|nr:hypothetical protein LSAT_V11C600330540 [Lactuca sativa]